MPLMPSVLHRASLFLAPLAVALSSADAQSSDALRDTIEARSRAFFTASRTPGLAVGVWKGGKAVYAGGFGVTVAGGQKPVTSRTVFHMASISKTFVGTAVMQLVEQGKVRLDEPIVKYVPYFEVRHPRSATITVRQVLSHTAGIPDVTDYAWDSPQYDDKALERWIRTLKDSSLVFEPGTDFRYSNIGFELLADLVAVVSGETFEGYVQRHILTPAGMAHSTFLMTDVDSANLATGHEMVAGVQTPRGYPYNRRHAGSSTMHSGVDDMLRYGVMHANRGSIDGKRILKRETYNLLWKTEFDLSQRRAPRIALSRATSSRPMTKVSMGLGWFVYDFSGERVVNHDGGDRGFRSSLWIAPDRGVVAVVFANAGANAPELALSLLELALGIRPLPPPKTVELTAAERAKYVGVYALPSGPNSLDMTIFEQNGGLFVRVQGQNARPLAAYGNDTFGSSFDPTLRLTFTIENGKATKVVLTQGGQRFEAPRK